MDATRAERRAARMAYLQTITRDEWQSIQREGRCLRPLHRVAEIILAFRELQQGPIGRRANDRAERGNTMDNT